MVSGNGTKGVFLEGLLTLRNIEEKVQIFEIIESRKPMGNTDDLFGLKRVSFCKKILYKFLA